MSSVTSAPLRCAPRSSPVSPARWRLTRDGKPAAGLEFEITRGGTRYRNAQEEIKVTSDKKGEFSVTWPEAGMYWGNVTTPQVEGEGEGFDPRLAGRQELELLQSLALHAALVLEANQLASAHAQLRRRTATDPLSEATVALQQLGYKPAEAARMARDAMADGDDAATIIRKALKSALR